MALLFTCFISQAQNSFNQYNSRKKKQGYWKVFFDERSFIITDSSAACFYGYVYYDNGKKIIYPKNRGWEKKNFTYTGPAVHDVSRLVLKKLNIDPPSDSYPQSLRPWLERKVWTTTVRKLLIESHQTELSGIFIKPRSKAKLFTGFVLRSNAGLSKLDGCAKDTELYVSEEVEWLSEYRVFVMDGKIVGTRIYSGDPIHSLDMQIVEQAIAAFEASDERTSAYGIDFGVLANGSTALVEWNDGYSLGSYGLDKELYTDLILRRWEELMKQILI
jgi:hypothetical protein